MIGIKKITESNQRWMVGALIVGGLVAACSLAVLLLIVVINPSSETSAVTEKAKPAVVETDESTGLSRVTLLQTASDRLGIETVPIADAEAVREGSFGDRIIPYGAVLYDVNGNTFVYTNPELLTYVRAPITIDYIEGDLAVLLDGPPTGTAVVTVGAAELFGAETGVGK